MKIANNAGFVGAKWTSFVAEVDWTLSEPYGEEKIVFVKFRDAIGWESEADLDLIMLLPEPGLMIVFKLIILGYLIFLKK